MPHMGRHNTTVTQPDASRPRSLDFMILGSIHAVSRFDFLHSSILCPWRGGSRRLWCFLWASYTVAGQSGLMH